MKIFLSFFVLLGSLTAAANESGILFQGQKYVLFKNGKKVGEEPEAVRKPASLASSSWLAIRYEVDEQNKVICYYNYDSPDKSAAISCVSKK